MIKRKNKKAISELISYVLLITLAIAMAGGVYAYLRFYAENPLPEGPCDGISVAIEGYNCDENIMYLDIKNTGRFETFVKVKLYNNLGKVVGEGEIIKTSGGGWQKIKINEPGSGEIIYDEEVVRIEVIPFIMEEGNTKFCPEVKIVQEVEGCEFSGAAAQPT